MPLGPAAPSKKMLAGLGQAGRIRRPRAASGRRISCCPPSPPQLVARPSMELLANRPADKAVQRGPPQSGAARRGVARSGLVPSGPARSSPVRSSPVKSGPARAPFGQRAVGSPTRRAPVPSMELLANGPADQPPRRRTPKWPKRQAERSLNQEAVPCAPRPPRLPRSPRLPRAAPRRPARDARDDRHAHPLLRPAARPPACCSFTHAMDRLAGCRSIFPPLRPCGRPLLGAWLPDQLAGRPAGARALQSETWDAAGLLLSEALPGRPPRPAPALSHDRPPLL